MQKVILHIQPQLRSTTSTQDFVRVDLMEEELISLTQVIQDYNDIEKIFTDYSRTFNLPASKTNNKIFQYWYNPDVIGFDNQIFCDARLELNHFHFKFGKIRLEEVVMKNQVPSMYKVTFFGNTTEFNIAINDDELSDLLWLNGFNHSATDTIVKNGLQSGLTFFVDSVQYTNALIYPLIAHSQQYVYDSVGTTLLTGTATSSSSSKLVDTSENFTDIVVVGDVVKNTTDNTTAIVESIDSNTELTLSSDIMSTGENYTIFKANGLNIFRSGQNLGKRGVFPEDLKPALTVRSIIKGIEEQYGITFKSGEFFDSAAMDNLYMWLHREKGKMATAGTWIGDSNTYTCSGSNCSELTDTTDTRGYFETSTGILYWHKQRVDPGFTVLTDETVLTLQITPASGYASVVYDMEIVRANNWERFVSLDNNTGTSTITLNIGGTNGFDVDTVYNANPFPTNVQQILSGDFNFTRFVGRISSESSIQFQATFNLTRTIHVKRDSNNSDFLNFSYSATFTSDSSTISPQDKLVVITEQMPKLKIKDFLNGLFRQFNLTAYVDFNNEIVVKTLDNYYAGGDSHDITEYVKTDKHTVCDIIPFSEIDFEYSEPKSILAQQFESINNKKYGELNFISDVSKKSVYQIKIPFEHMLFSRLNDLSAGTQTDIQTGCFLDQELNPSIGQPLLFYGILRTSISTPFNFCENTRPETYGALAENTQSNSQLNSYWMPHHASGLGTRTTAATYNLNFGSEIDTYNLTDYAGNNNSLFQLYYQNYITRVFNKKTRVFKHNAILPLKVLLNLTLDDLIVIGTRAYTINKMITKLQSGETQFELLNEPPE